VERSLLKSREVASRAELPDPRVTADDEELAARRVGINSQIVIVGGGSPGSLRRTHCGNADADLGPDRRRKPPHISAAALSGGNGVSLSPAEIGRASSVSCRCEAANLSVTPGGGYDGLRRCFAHIKASAPEVGVRRSRSIILVVATG